MELLVLASFVLIAVALGAIPFLSFNRDASKLGGSVLTNALLYRKLSEENVLRSEEISALRARKRALRLSETNDRVSRWKDSQKAFIDSLSK